MTPLEAQEICMPLGNFSEIAAMRLRKEAELNMWCDHFHIRWIEVGSPTEFFIDVAGYTTNIGNTINEAIKYMERNYG